MENLQHVSLTLKDITVTFPGVRALDKVDYSIESGKIYALIGANGAGKSTLMKVISGVNSNYEGQIYLDEKPIEIRSPKDAFSMGIQTVYQEVDTALIPNLSVAENIYLNTLVNHMQKKRVLNWTEIYRVAQEQLRDLQININVRKRINELSLAEKQMVLIAKAVLEDCRILLLDEPTAPLSNTETDQLFQIVRDLVRKKNVAVVFISHRLSELFEICEEITIMKEGRIVHRQQIDADLTIAHIVDYMLGESKKEMFQRKETDLGKTVLSVKNLSEKSGKVNNINLEVKEGEIVGVAGLVGAGKTELCKSLFGAYRVEADAYMLGDKSVKHKKPTCAVKNGMALIPEERRKEGIFVANSVFANVTLSALSKFSNRFGFVSKSKQLETTKKIVESLDIKTPNHRQKVGLLSGGNQQKVVIGKWLATDAKVFIFDEPTKGVDIGAKNDIYSLIEGLAREGKGVIYATCEFSEILAITDRVLIMYDGKIVKEVKTSETNEKELLYYSTGGR